MWELRYSQKGPGNTRLLRAVTVGSLKEFPSEAAARKSSLVQAIMMRVNSDHPCGPDTVPTVGALLSKYELEEMPERYSTRLSYQSFIKNHIRPYWADVPLDRVKPMAIEDWLKGLGLAPKTKGHIRGLMSTIFKCGQRWELTEENPLELVRVKGSSRRLERPSIITAGEFRSVLGNLREPFRSMVLVAGCLGLRAGEIMGLKWSDFDFQQATLYVQRGVVHGRIGDVKTEYSRDTIPIAPELAALLLTYREQSYPTSEDWLFANPRTGKPYHQEEVQKRHLRTAGRSAGIQCVLGWKTFRHSYRSWLEESGAAMGVQRELMRHASVQTTMNVYGRAVSTTKRQAQENVVKLVFVQNNEAAEGASTTPAA